MPPIAESRRRITLAPPAASLVAHPSPTVADVRALAPETRRAALDALTALGQRHSVTPRPIGSLFWQALTGFGYLTPASELDVLWPIADPVDADRLRHLLDGIAETAEGAPMRLDGEILLLDGSGIQWRKLREAPDDDAILVKHRGRIAMCPVTLFRRDRERAMTGGASRSRAPATGSAWRDGRIDQTIAAVTEPLDCAEYSLAQSASTPRMSFWKYSQKRRSIAALRSPDGPQAQHAFPTLSLTRTPRRS